MVKKFIKWYFHKFAKSNKILDDSRESVDMLRELTLELIERDAQLRESEAKFRGLFENSLNGIAIYEAVLDAKGEPVKFIYNMANAAFEIQTGLRVESIIGADITEHNPWMIELGIIDRYKEVYRTGIPVVFKDLKVSEDRYYDLTIFKISEKYCSGIVINITESKKLGTKFLELFSKHKKLLDVLDLHIWFLNDPYTFNTVNSSTAEHFGTATVYLENTLISDFFKDSEFLNVHIANNKKCFDEKIAFETLEWIPDSKGKQHLFTVKRAPVLDDAGNILYIIGRSAELTEFIQNGNCINDTTKKCPYEKFRNKINKFALSVEV